MSSPTSSRLPGAEWREILRQNGTTEFAAAFARNPVLETSVLNGPCIGVDAIGAFFAATAGGMYDSLAFTGEALDGRKTYLEWEGKALGRDVAGTTILTRNEAGLIQSIRLYHRPLPILLQFARELANRLQGKIDPSLLGTWIAVEHIRISSGRPFAEVRRRLEGAVPRLDAGIAEALQSGDTKRAEDYEASGPNLSIFEVRDHGSLLQIVGRAQNALQYEIGNPLTASKMTRHQLPAALYAPLRVVLFEDEQGRGIFEYDKPSSFFGQYGDERVTEVGRYLDAALEAILRNAAE
jgi:uncharacterized protein (DUF302 family)